MFLVWNRRVAMGLGDLVLGFGFLGSGLGGSVGWEVECGDAGVRFILNLWPFDGFFISFR